MAMNSYERDNSVFESVYGKLDREDYTNFVRAYYSNDPFNSLEYVYGKVDYETFKSVQAGIISGYRYRGR